MAKVVTVKGRPVLRDDWHIEDIFMVADEMEEELTEDDAIKVMRLIAEASNAEIGINWDVIEATIQQYKEK
jgi:hypothetical protein